MFSLAYRELYRGVAVAENMGSTRQIMIQPVPWKMRLRMLVGMKNEILNGIKKLPFYGSFQIFMIHKRDIYVCTKLKEICHKKNVGFQL